METPKDPNIMPHIEVLPNPFKAAGKAVVRFFCIHQLSPISDHTFENRGGGPMLDREIDKNLLNMNQMVFDYGED